MKDRRKPKRSDLDVKALRELLDSGAVGEVTLHQDTQEITKWVEDEEAAIEDRREFTAGVSWHVEWGFKKVGRAKGQPKSKAKTTHSGQGQGLHTWMEISPKVPEWYALEESFGCSGGFLSASRHARLKLLDTEEGHC